MNKKEMKISSLQEEFNRIQEENKDVDITKHLATREDMPDFGEIQIYDYNIDLENCNKEGIDMLKDMVDLYLGDNPSIANHSYIQRKMKADAKVYSRTLFLDEMTVKNFLTQLRQVDNGDNSARMHEVINQSVAQIRDNIKFAQTQRTELEKFYKDMRKDMGLTEISESMEKKITSNNVDDGEEDGRIIDTRNLNDMIDKLIKGDKK